MTKKRKVYAVPADPEDRRELAIAAADRNCAIRRLPDDDEWDDEAWDLFDEVMCDDKTALAFARKLKWED